MTIKNIGIVGYGSIGQKHHQILSSISNEFEFFINTQQQGIKNSFNSLESFSSQDLDYIIIANPTSLHYETLKFLDEQYKKIKFLVEKPLFNNPQSFTSSSNIYTVGYNLRFHQIIIEFLKLINDKEIISISFKTYSYLPHWRKNIDYQNSASAKKSMGGGVLRDLSHEIDLLNFLFGDSIFTYADSRKVSNLDIETDDFLLACGKLESGAPITIELNYFSRLNSREIFVETTQESIKLDLANFNLTIIGEKTSFVKYDDNINSSYKAMHQAIINDNFDDACSLHEGLRVLKQIEQLENLSLS
jgi:predicted dehydrogenase